MVCSLINALQNRAMYRNLDQFLHKISAKSNSAVSTKLAVCVFVGRL